MFLVFWDTFRCLFLLNPYPLQNMKMQEGLVNTYKERVSAGMGKPDTQRSAWLETTSRWPVVADAYLKGLEGYDIETLWEVTWSECSASRCSFWTIRTWFRNADYEHERL